MIEFNCPECDEPMEISDRMAGKQTDCVNCGVRLAVPEEPDAPRGRGRKKRKRPTMPRGDLRQI
ncbi:MAG: hypothetical protein K1X57_21900, partial [Gemmataceae bacterium]|nr:hypothetical protein [Gemmataceae bacterium]